MTASRSVSVQRTGDTNALETLIAKHGNANASRMLGLADVSSLITEEGARPAYVMAAKYLLQQEAPKTVPLMVVCDNAEVLKAVKQMVDAVGGQHMDLDL